MTEQTSKFSLKFHWSSYLLAFLFILLYFQVITGLVEHWWEDPNYSHGFLVPLISAYLVWKKKDRLKTLESKRSYPGLIIMLLGLGIYIIGTAGAEYFSARFSMIVVLFGLVFFLNGKEWAKELLFPIAFLGFMIPIPYVIYYAISFPMQLFSSKLTYMLLHFIGLPSIRQGNIIHLPNYSLEVVEACSGLRSLVSLLALGAFFAYITFKSNLKRIILFLSVFPIAIGANIFRIFVTALGAYVVSPKLAEDFLHKVSGLIVFLIAVFSLFIFSQIIKLLSLKRK
ncbi:MAG: exosortase/archaeosortase family protein [candidate division Zixibacteria bacterium]|nr:exosortase/archaeosortase family protein [candidate division Zixibacteria bacterium]